MPTPRSLVALLRAPGGDPWQTATAEVVEILTSSVHETGESTQAVTRLLGNDGLLACTSPRAAQWMAALPVEVGRGLVVCSGRRTARILEAGGWQAILPAEGETSGGAPAARRILSIASARAGAVAVLYVRGRETAGSFERVLDDAGQRHESLVVYDLRQRDAILPEEADLLASCDAIAVMAPSCLRFLEHLDHHVLVRLRERVPALAGPTTSEALRRAGWRDVREAPEPSCSALLSLLDPPDPSPNRRLPMPSSSDWFQRSCAVTPGGVHSPVRAFRNVGSEPFYVASARGSRLTTVDGRELVDWVGSWGPMILGHNHPEVARAIVESVASGTSFGACSVPEVELSEEIVRRVPGVDMVRLVNSGTEATMSAARLARGVTGRDAIVKFRGCYHGHGDSFLVAAGSGALTHGNPSSPGVTAGTARDTLLADFNDLESVEALFRAHPEGIAAVFVEPVPGNMGVVPALPGFLEGLRALCTREGALLVMDEVMTGFRLARGGAVERFGIQGDLVTLGKIAGGGLPLAAFAGPRRIMERLSPVGPVYQAGTLSGNPLACRAGLALLGLLDESVYARLEQLGARLEGTLRRGILSRRNDLSFQRVGSMATFFFHAPDVTTFAQVQACDNAAYGRFFQEMLRRGHFLPPAQFEAFFLSTAHSEEDVDLFARDIEASALVALETA